MLIEEQNS